MNGYSGGSVRAPLKAPDEESRLEITRLLEEAKTSFATSTQKTGNRAAMITERAVTGTKKRILRKMVR